ncbi:hypothetical protein Sjap_015869 [Stephania japonica]|uniref:F-box domain-containing protein n=1 Tax=Stephania japonica TaxID=461633 RepID=A0AAP0IK80_9MAGN
MEDPPLKKTSEEEELKEVGIGSIGDDALQQILSRLPAKSFAYAACVCSSWSRVCARVLSRPKLVSALCLIDRVDENDETIAQADIRQRLGSGITIIVNKTRGVIGADTVTD